MDFLKALEDEFKDILNSKKEEETSDKKPEGNKKMENLINKENVPFLWIGALVLAVVTWFNYQSKINNQYVNQPSTGSTDIAQSTPPWYKNNAEQKESVSADEKVETLKLAVQKIWDRTKWNTDRTILLSIVSNNNNYVIKNNYSKSELIFLNSDWTINKMPTVLNLDEADKEFLKQFVKP
jgi:hypothetical protein